MTSTSPTASGVSALSGVDGKVVINNKIISRVKQWTLNNTWAESAWGDSGSGGYTFRKRARNDATGTVVGVMDDGANNRIYAEIASAATDFVGRSVTISLWEKHGDAGRGWWFPCALIQSFDITLDMDTKEVVEYTLSWGADGIFYRPAQSNGAPEAGS